MRNLFKVFGIIALVAIIGLSFAACDDGSTGPGGPGGGGGGDGSGGGLTITDIPAQYIGMWVKVENVGEGLTLVAFSVGKVRISSERVTIPLCLPKDQRTRFNGSGALGVDVRFYTNETGEWSFRIDSNIWASTVQFYNGNATISWNDYHVINR